MKKTLFILIVSLLLIFSAVYHASRPAGLNIDFIDAGEGDSILIRTPHGKNILIDTGNLITGYKVLGYLRKRDVHSLDYLILTHPHPDHIGGVFIIAQMMKAAKIYDNGYDLGGATDDLYRWYCELIRDRTEYAVLQAGDILKVDGVVLSLLWPYMDSGLSGFNENSLVIGLEYKGFRCLLMGDATIPVEKELLAKKKDLKADILKVGHHGHSDASSGEFLESVSPRIAIISVNKENIRGYPSKNVIRDLEALGIKVYRTDEDGGISVDVKRDGDFKIRTRL